MRHWSSYGDCSTSHISSPGYPEPSLYYHDPPPDWGYSGSGYTGGGQYGGGFSGASHHTSQSSYQAGPARPNTSQQTHIDEAINILRSQVDFSQVVESFSFLLVHSQHILFQSRDPLSSFFFFLRLGVTKSNDSQVHYRMILLSLIALLKKHIFVCLFWGSSVPFFK